MKCANELYRGLKISNLVLKAMCNLMLNTSGDVMGFIYGDGLEIDFLILGYEFLSDLGYYCKIQCRFCDEIH